MAKLSAHGTELARIDAIIVRYSIRSDGHILRNGGSGWKLWRKTSNPVDYAETATARQATLATDYPARQAYKLALHRVAPLAYRWVVDSTIGGRAYADIETLSANWDGNYRYEPQAPKLSLEQWRELDQLYRAMGTEREEHKIGA
jgi:hypothetical protein